MAKRILLIDDDQEEADIFKDAVKEADHDAIFHYVNNCVKAIKQLKERILPIPNLIFIDINMPFMNGLDCLKELKGTEGLRRIPIVIYSTSERPDDAQAAIHLGAMAFLTKPNKYSDLLKKLKDLIHSVLFE